MNIRLVLLLIRVVLLIIGAIIGIAAILLGLSVTSVMVYTLITAPEWQHNVIGWVCAVFEAVTLCYVAFLLLSRKICHQPLSPTSWS